ncbi:MULTISPECIES: 6-phosphogluconate dehydrogenase [unclassified Flavobacterium]|uniref:6-phosphogluconate dehydrogenase n=1 Tax=unclassified Flavobacterium TaxID=196869 RepID=UPI00362069AC
MLRKIIIIGILTLILGVTGYFTVFYYATYSEGDQTGQLVKFSHKGYIFKTWEGEISKGIYGTQVFKFSVMDKDADVIRQLRALQGHYVKATYIERYKTFPWWGDTKHFIIKVQEEKQPQHFNN